MAFYDKIIKQLFPQKTTEANVKTPYLSEPIQRSKRYEQEYFRWLNEGHFRKILEVIDSAYENKRASQPDVIDVHLLQSIYANGIAITYNADIFSFQTFHFLFDYLKEKVVPLGYKENIAERKMYDKATYVETVEKYYLKPDMPLGENGLFDQLYGNVLIELVLVNDKPSYIKLLVSLYSDRLYTEALPFEDFKMNVFS